MDLSPGTTLSHYRVASRIGAGGMGEVYLAQDTKLERKVALKILPKALAIDEDLIRRLHRLRRWTRQRRIERECVVSIGATSAEETRLTFVSFFAAFSLLRNLCNQRIILY